MIKFADTTTALQVRTMWKTCFGDNEEFMNLYFTEKYKNENTLLYLIDNKAVASLQILPYEMSFDGNDVSIGYISGACTLPEHRKMGYMEKLLFAAFDVMKQRNIPITILIPAEKWLFNFYSKYGYVQTFAAASTNYSLDNILKNNTNEESAFREFKLMFQDKNIYIKKNIEDFKTIIKAHQQEDPRPSIINNLDAMSRIIDARYLLNLFANKYTGIPFSIKVQDDLLDNNSKTYLITGKSCSEETIANPTFEMNIQTLCQLLFGFNIVDIDKKYSNYFNSHNPVINLMLE